MKKPDKWHSKCTHYYARLDQKSKSIFIGHAQKGISREFEKTTSKLKNYNLISRKMGSLYPSPKNDSHFKSVYLPCPYFRDGAIFWIPWCPWPDFCPLDLNHIDKLVTFNGICENKLYMNSTVERLFIILIWMIESHCFMDKIDIVSLEYDFFSKIWQYIQD